MARKPREHESEHPPTTSWRELLELSRKGKLRSLEDAPEFVDFSEIYDHLRKLRNKGKENGKENSWVITPSDLVFLAEGKQNSVSFADVESIANGEGIAHNHPSFRHLGRDSKENPEVEDYLSLTDFILFTSIKNNQNFPFLYNIVVSGNHIFIAFRTEKTPIHDKKSTIELLFLVLRTGLFYGSLNLTVFLQNILDILQYKFNVSYPENFDNIVEKNARRLNKTVANQWNIALYEIPNFERVRDNDNMGRLINKE